MSLLIRTLPTFTPRIGIHMPMIVWQTFMGANIEFMRSQPDGAAWIDFGYRTGIVCHGDTNQWTPPSCTEGPTNKFYPYPNTPPGTGNDTYTSRKIDAIYGLARYIVDFAGYYSDPAGSTGPYHDVWSYSSQYVNGTIMPEWQQDPDYYHKLPQGTLQSTEGATESSVMTEIDAGRPVIITVVDCDNYKTCHAFPVWGYEQVEGQPLQMLAYDEWNEDCITNPDTELPYEITSYRIVPFPTPYEAAHNLCSFERKSAAPGYNPLYTTHQGRYWRLYGISFLRINTDDPDHARCLAPLGDDDYPSSTYAHSFDINFSLADGSSRVHYTLDGTDPNPHSPYAKLTGGAGTLYIDHGCSPRFRTYHDGTSTEDGYIASAVVGREYTVTSPDSKLTKYANGTGIITVPLVVTMGTAGSANYCYVEDQKRLSGIRVQLGKADTVAEGAQVSVSGALDTNGAGERFIDNASVTDMGPPAFTVSPLAMPNRAVGGSDLSYDGGSTVAQQGVTDGAGLNNIGLLITTTGCVNDATDTTFDVSDGSNAVALCANMYETASRV